ncbi:MAG TPA: DUF1553 domain-containing protein, partial [Armatimonadota bacterium]|nr:DUF1553 domain-containing protein [Armatimonadota bacterium]
PAEHYAKDPENRLLARGPRHRVDAESVRDIALAAGGLLTPTVGGPSVFAPQPDGVAALSIGGGQWNTESGPNRYRRGMYTFQKRLTPYPAFMLFDAPGRELTCIRRQRSNTPLQALNTLNDVVYVEAAQAMARRVLKEGWGGPEQRVRFAFRLCLSRGPSASESRRAIAFLQEQRAVYAAAPAEAAQVAGIDPKAPPAGADPAELAAWTLLSRVLLNLDETITKE